MFSKKVKQTDAIFNVDLTITKQCQIDGAVNISSIFVAFLENMNFNVINDFTMGY